MIKSKRYLPFPLFLLIAGVVGLSTWYFIKSNAPKPEPITINEVVSTGTVTLAFGAPVSPLLQNTVSILPITINTFTSRVTAASFAITYDPTKVLISAVAHGDSLPNTLAAPVFTSGKVTFTYTVPATTGSYKQGTGVVAKLSVKPLTTGPFTLTFGTGTMVTAIGATGNVLKIANPITLTPQTPINGGWSGWSTKVTTCGYTGTQTRTCTNPTPQYGGATCTGSSTQSYTNPPCAILGDLTENGDVPGDHVNLFDYNLLVSNYGNPYTIYDYNNLVTNYGQ